jgi:hypothetical protein
MGQAWRASSNIDSVDVIATALMRIEQSPANVPATWSTAFS